MMKLAIAFLLMGIASIASPSSSIRFGSPREQTDNLEEGSNDGSDVTTAAMKKHRVRHLRKKVTKTSPSNKAGKSKSAKKGKTGKKDKTTTTTSTLMATTTTTTTTTAVFPPLGNEFQDPEDGVDLRSPCPAINTIANHGFITRNGTRVNVTELAQALEDVYNVLGETLVQGPINAAIELGLTDTADGQICTVELNEEGETCFLDLDNLFEAKGGKPDRAQEHDSSFVREDFGQESGVDDQLPSPRLIELLFDSTTREILQPYEIMEYQRQRIQDSCERRQDRADGFEREYTDEHRGGMAIQGSLLFVLAQISVDEPAFMKLNKANLRSILEKEKLPWNFNPAANQRFTFFDNVPSDNFRDAFRQNIETAICAFCNESTNECDRELARIGNLHCFSDPDGDGVNTIWPVCSGKEEEEFCDGDGDCDDTDFCNCDVGQSFCSTGVNPCVSTASVGRV